MATLETLKSDTVSVKIENNEKSAEIVEVLKIDEVNGNEEGIDTPDRRTRRQNNTFAAKKTVAQGMMDVALITANANQLRYLIEYQRRSSTFYMNFCLIIVSLLLQVAVGISLIFKGRCDLRGQSKSLMARRINNYVVVGVFLITIINVFVAAFSISVEPQTYNSLKL